ncbi:hypothetical protein Q7P35_008353 [Cladosporium inversicolor]
MEPDTLFQILFGIIATLLALFGLWLTWHLATRMKASQLPKSHVLPSYNGPRISANQRLWGRRRILFVEDNIDHLSLYDQYLVNPVYGPRGAAGLTDS